MKYVLGIDVGTTYTAAATLREGEPPEVFGFGIANAVESVAYAHDGELVFGPQAVTRGRLDPAGMARAFKRRVGTETPIVLSGGTYSGAELTAGMAGWVRDEVVEQKGSEPERIAIAHPANWTDKERYRLTEALGDVGLKHTLFISEPAAAALDYAATVDLEPGTLVLVYDLGGGTFDVAILRRTSSGFELEGFPEGIPELGGIDFDDMVFDFVRQRIPSGVLDAARGSERGGGDLADLRQACVAEKENLSSRQAVDVPVKLQDFVGSVRLTRREFEAMIAPKIQQTIDLVSGTMRKAHLGPSALHGVLLVGGSSRIPFVGQLLGQCLPVTVRVDLHPKQPVARGTARHAAGRSRPTRRDQARTRPSRTEVPETAHETRAARGKPDQRPPHDRPSQPAHRDDQTRRSAAAEEPAPVRARSIAPTADIEPDVLPAATPPDRARRRRLAVVSGVIAATILVSALVIILSRGDEGERASGPTFPPSTPTVIAAPAFEGVRLALLTVGPDADPSGEALSLAISDAVDAEPRPSFVGAIGSVADLPVNTDAVVVGPGASVTLADLDELQALGMVVCVAGPVEGLMTGPRLLDLGVSSGARSGAEDALRREGVEVVAVTNAAPAPGQVMLVAGGDVRVAQHLVTRYGAAAGDAARVYDCAAAITAAWWSAGGEVDALDLGAPGAPCADIADCRNDQGSHWSGRDVMLVGLGGDDHRWQCTDRGCNEL